MTLPEMALRWEVQAHLDDNTCKPCRDNARKKYRNRQAAYRDYPNGRGYKKCVGADYGNTCRCTVKKRGKGGENVKRDLASMIARAQALTAGVTARNLLPPRPDGAPPLAAMEGFRAEANKLYVYDAIGGWDGAKAIDVVQALAGMTGPLDIHLNSPGGVIFEGVAMYNAIRGYTGGPVTAYIDGYAASAASFVALAASPYDAEADTGGVRIADNAVMMIHDGMGLAIGTADDMRDTADLLDMLSDTIADIYAKRCGGTAEDWRDQMREGDTWYNATEAKEAKLADLIVGAPAAKASGGVLAKLDLAMFVPGERTCTQPAPAVSTPFASEGFLNALKGAHR